MKGVIFVYWDCDYGPLREQQKGNCTMVSYIIFLGIAPAIFGLWFFYRKDKLDPEPKGLIIELFFWGLVIMLPVFLVEWLAMNILALTFTETERNLYLIFCFVIVGPLEEISKYLMVKMGTSHSKDFNEPADGVIYMVSAAMGFAALENIKNIFLGGPYSTLLAATEVGFVSGLLATPAHALFSGIIGASMGKARFAATPQKSFLLVFSGILLAVVLHGLYAFLMISEIYIAVPILLVVVGFIFWKEFKRLLKESPLIEELQKIEE